MCGLPPVDRNLARFGDLIFLSLSPGQADTTYIKVEPLGLPAMATPEDVARAAHAGELYFAPPGHLVTVNGTIVALIGLNYPLQLSAAVRGA